MAKRKPAKNDMTKTGAVRTAVQEGVTDNQGIVDFAKDRFGLLMTKQQVSIIKTGVNKELRGESSRAKRKPARAARPEVQVSRQTGGSYSVEDISAVKGLVDRMGAQAVRELVEVLG